MNADRTLEVGVPSPGADEAVSSWISRLALAQGCSLEEMLDFLGLKPRTDIDSCFDGEVAQRVRRKCGLAPTAFQHVERVNACMRWRGIGRAVLLRQQDNSPRFRYCPMCLRKRVAPKLPFIWRFREWRYCPAHGCLMEARCWRCSRPVRFPIDMATSMAGRDGHASQRRCMRCSVDLSTALPCNLDLFDRSLLTAVEAHWLEAGRVQVEALFQSTLSEATWAELQTIAKSSWLPSTWQWGRLEARLRAACAGDSRPELVEPDRLNINWARKAFFVEERRLWPGDTRTPPRDLKQPFRSFFDQGTWWCRRSVEAAESDSAEERRVEALQGLCAIGAGH